MVTWGGVAIYQGDYSAARAYIEQSLEIYREIENKHGITIALSNLGNVAIDQGDYAAAMAYHEQTLKISEEIGNRPGIASSQMGLGNVAKFQGDYGAARAFYEQSVEIRKEIGDRQGMVESMEAFAMLAASSCHISALPTETTTAPENVGAYLQRAPRLWGAAQALREQIGAPLSPGEQKEQDAKVAEARQQLDGEEWTAAWEAGRQMSLEEAVAYALQGNEEG
ncbi:MAG: tetratricopeptide repeat protein [Chthonomonadales bacterium]